MHLTPDRIRPNTSSATDDEAEASWDDARSQAELAAPLILMLGHCEDNDGGLEDHCAAVGELACYIGGRLGLSQSVKRKLGLAGVLHDVGKVMIPESILSKPGPLSPWEREQIRRHPETGYQLIREVGLDEIAHWVRTHHERPDGRGYPFGSKSRPLGGAILAVADAYHAMTANRPYQRALDHSHARMEMQRCSGTQFEPEVLGALFGSATNRPSAFPACPSRPVYA